MRTRAATRYPAVPLVLLALALAAGSPLLRAQTVDDLEIMTENHPPYNYEENGRLQGIATELMGLMLERVSSRQTLEDVKLVPWPRAYHLTLSKRNTVLFSTTRTTPRERLFEWVGPISTTTIGMTARRDRKVTVRSLADLKDYRVGVVESDIGQQLLMNAGVLSQELDAVDGPGAILTSIEKLNTGRIDVFTYDINAAHWVIKANGFSLEDYETVYVLKERELYYAFHKGTPQPVLQQLQAALDALKAEGSYEAIVRRYVP